jgi:hypothetical protein
VVPDLGLVVVVLSTSPTDPTTPPEPGTAQASAYVDLVNLECSRFSGHQFRLPVG